jgi:CYTH domain-containing protein
LDSKTRFSHPECPLTCLSFEIHKYNGESLDLLYVQLSDATSTGKIPPFLSVTEEVTGMAKYSANQLSLALPT